MRGGREGGSSAGIYDSLRCVPETSNNVKQLYSNLKNVKKKKNIYIYIYVYRTKTSVSLEAEGRFL